MNIQQLKQFKVLVIGDSCQDIYHYGSCDRLSPEAPVPVFKELNKISMPGMSANVSKNLQSLGINVTHVTNQSIIYKHRFVDFRSRQHLLRVDIGEEKKIEKIDILKIKTIKNFNAVVVSDYNKGFLEPEDCKEICKHFNLKKIPIFVDSKKKDLSCFKNCIIKINEKETDSAVLPPENCKIITTLGDRGALYNGVIYKTSAVDVFDVSGAGDVFLSALVFGFLQHGSIHNAIPFANKCASISVSKTGTYVLTKEDIK